MSETPRNQIYMINEVHGRGDRNRAAEEAQETSKLREKLIGGKPTSKSCTV